MIKRNKSKLIEIAIIIVLALLAHTFLALAIVNGKSMYNTLDDGDVMLIRRVGAIKRNDIVAIWSDDLQEILCKRVIGIEGDHIEIKEGVLYRNNEEVKEEYIYEKEWGYSYNDRPINIDIAEGQVFVMGDNRNNSTDSRVLGPLDKQDIKGVNIYKLPFKYRNIQIILIVMWVVLIILFFLPTKKNNEQEIDKNEQVEE